MLKLHQIYLRKFLLLFLLLFFVIGAIIYFWLKEIYLDHTKNSLIQKINLVSIHIKNNYDLDSLAIDIKKDLDLRLTIIDQLGDVISESDEDKKNMENHKYRDEIVQLNKNDIGEAIRYSKTVNKDFLYIAKRFNIDGKTYFIRIAKALSKINNQIIKLGYEVFIALFIFFIFLFYISYKLSKDIQNEIKSISKFLWELTKKRKNTYIKSSFSQEFSQMTELLTKVSKILSKKDKQKAKYTAKLRASNEEKDDIISAISHEFKNPIAVINGYSQTLIDDPNMKQDIQNKFLKKIYKSGNRLNELIDTLRLSIKLDDGKQLLDYKELDLNSLIKDLAESLQANYKNRTIEIKGDENCFIKADKVLLGIAIINLIENALKYSEDNVKVVFTKKYVTITDSGIGIKAKDLDKITDKFYRVSTNSWNNSLGLGLSIVSNIVKKHNFTLEITTKEHKGSSFTIKF